MTVRIGINGFGRIGRLCLRSALSENSDKATVMAINDHSKDLDYLMYMLRYDSVHGKSTISEINFPGIFKGKIEKTSGGLLIDGKKVFVTKEKDPTFITWGDFGAEYIMECSGQVLTHENGLKHMSNGAKKVLMSSPPKDDTPMFVHGVNNDSYKPEMKIVSNASCTTNCLAPLAKVVHDNFGIEEGLMTTVHAMTIN